MTRDRTPKWRPSHRLALQARRRKCEPAKGSVNELGLSARAHDKVLRVSPTIADLDHSDAIKPPYVSEAINYRMLDRNLWK